LIHAPTAPDGAAGALWISHRGSYHKHLAALRRTTVRGSRIEALESPALACNNPVVFTSRMWKARTPVTANPLLEVHRFLRRGPVNAEGWSQLVAKDREWERSYRGRWAHDKVVRSTHGVNCTGSCSWNVFVKDGLITWENQAVDYPSTGPEMPEYEPRGCP